MNIIIDTNIWISFTIGKRLQHLKPLLTNPKLKIYICNLLKRHGWSKKKVRPSHPKSNKQE